jgi:hypothetical protein
MVLVPVGSLVSTNYRLYLSGYSRASSDLFKECDLSIPFFASKRISIQRPGIEPGTSAVLKPRHNQLDHLC